MNAIATKTIATDGNQPLWIERLQQECAKNSQAKVAKLLGYSATAINQVLKEKYKGDLNAIETAVRGVYLGDTVHCPVMGEIPTSDCQQNQKQKYANTNSTRVALYQACNRTCPNSAKNNNNEET